jgi:hypothetical protein
MRRKGRIAGRVVVVLLLVAAEIISYLVSLMHSSIKASHLQH